MSITPKAHGLLFTAPMIRAFLRSRNPKTQTRRIPTAANSLVDGDGMSAKRWAAMNFDFSRAFVDKGPSPAGNLGPYIKVPAINVIYNGGDETWHRIYPRVQPGALIWAKETYCLECQVERDQPPPHSDGREIKRDEEGKWLQPHYRATDPAPELAYEDGDGEPCVRWKSSMFMPRWASRIERTVASVRAERIANISSKDCEAEGVLCETADPMFFHIPTPGNVYAFAHDEPRGSYKLLWESINGADSWHASPITWVYDLQPVASAA